MSEPPSSPHSSHFNFRYQPDAWRSMSLSRLTFAGRDPGLGQTFAALALLGLVSAVLASLGVLLVLQLSARQFALSTAQAQAQAQARIGGADWSDRFLDAGVVLGCLSSVLCFGSVVTCSAQGYFAAKMLKLPQGEERAHRYLVDTSGSRFLAISCFFTAIPVFIAAFAMYVLREFRLVPAAVSTSFLGLGVIFAVATFGRSVRLWRRESDLADRGVAAFDCNHNGNSALSSVDGAARAPFTFTNHVNAAATETSTDANNLSTLV